MKASAAAIDRQISQGSELHRQGNSALAEVVYRQVLQQAPKNAKASFMLAVLLYSTGRLADARDSFKQAAETDDQWIDAQMNAGVVLYELQHFEEALEYLEKARQLSPKNLDVLVNLGNVLFELGRHQEAIDAFTRVVSETPKAQDARMNLANTLRDMRLFPQAVAAYDEALALDSNNAAVHFNRSLCLLTMGRLEEGWSEYEWRTQLPSLYDTKRKFKAPLWTGKEAIDGCTILLHAEQGLGDTMQFARYAKAVQARGASVVLEVQAPVAEVISTLEGTGKVTARGTDPGPYDFHCPLLSLPHCFQTSLATIPGEVPYLEAASDRVARWRPIIAAHGGLRIGLAWAGNAAYRQNHHRSISLSNILELLPSDSHAWSLQKEVSDADLELIRRTPQTDVFAANAFPDTAAQMASLDLVITVDTSIAHLAGALGRPVWVLLSSNADWRWMDGRNDSPWYPNARLFRQVRHGEWAPVLESVRLALHQLSLGRESSG